ncbi:tripartite motif-containing protein 59-like [Polyodon spathula]|uniref:tripartite motif-containing protein 59-like n=1 Tax=Polyodon spathula TaxID=7913 RepID=UPI001B7D96FD|nr:tripartite motif-containing protein 59-like [Polyodon spathula]XP_041120543.1 tripartite motif-containing protein 59-like [Polyodon spathula]
MDNLEEDLTCSVCYSLFDDPRVLPCSHTFCKGCLENVLHVSINFSIWRPLRIPLKCPNCRNTVELPPTGVDSLPVNVSLRAIVEKYQRNDQWKSALCLEHQGQPLNVYCLRDRQLICGLCLTLGQHQGHPIDDLHTAYIKERETPGRLLEKLTDKRGAEVCLLVERLEEQKVRCENTIKHDKEAVVQYFEKIHQILERKKQAFLAVLEEANAEVSSEFDPLIEKLNDIKEEHLDLISCSTAVEEEESPLAFLEKIHTFRGRVAALTKAGLPNVVPLEIYPRVEEFLKQKWSGITIGKIDEVPIPNISCCSVWCSRTIVDKNLNKLWASFITLWNPFVLLIFFLLLSLFSVKMLFNKDFFVYQINFSILTQINQMFQSCIYKTAAAAVYHVQEGAIYLYSLTMDILIYLKETVKLHVASICKILF